MMSKVNYRQKQSIIILLLMIYMPLESFSQRFGIRAGLNYSTLSGPVESGVSEKYSLTNGFHFGVNYAQQFAEFFSVKGEVVYVQYGTAYEYEGTSYYRISYKGSVINETGNTTMNLKISNAYISVPVTAQFSVFDKFEINAGLYANFLIQPRGAGQLRFTSTDHPQEVYFRQTLEHNYYKDVAGGGSLSGPTILVDKQPVQLYKNTGAYYQFLTSEIDGSLFNWFDYGLTGGISYYFTKGFYGSARYDYGLSDLTRNRMDPSKKSLDENGKFIFTNDFDRHTAIQLSLGFKF